MGVGRGKGVGEGKGRTPNNYLHNFPRESALGGAISLLAGGIVIEEGV